MASRFELRRDLGRAAELGPENRLALTLGGTDRDRLTPSRIFNENPSQPVGAVGVEYRRRTSNTLRALGFPAGIVPKLASKVVFTTQPVRIRVFANGPASGDPSACRPD